MPMCSNGHAVPDGANFCQVCGAPVEAAPTPAPSPPNVSESPPISPQLPDWKPGEPAPAPAATPQPTVPTKICPHCAVQSQTASDKCPNCGKKYKVKIKKRGGCLRVVLGIIGLLVVIGIIAAATHKSAPPVKAADVIDRVSGSFVRTGCFGCSNTDKIQTSDTYCGWDGTNVIVHVVFANTSVESLTVSWHPSYLIRNGTAHGTGLTSIQQTTVKPGATVAVFNRQSPAGTTAGSPIATCDPSFFDIQPT